MANEGPKYSEDVLNEVEGRALKFLSAAGRTPVIRAALETAGYDASEHDAGWNLLHKAARYEPTPDTAPVDPFVADAIRELDGLDEQLVTRVTAALRRLHPKQLGAALKNVTPGEGADAVKAVGTLLANLDALEKSSDGKAAIKTLAKRRIDAAERKRLAELLKRAEKLTTAAPAKDDGAREAALVALKDWYDDWADTARSVIKRRDLLIRLGLAERKSSKPEAPPAPTA